GVGAAGRAARGTGLVGVGVACFALAAAAPWLVRYLALGLAPDVPARVTDGALKSPWVLQPVVAHFSILSPSWAFVAMPVGLVVVALAALAASRGRVLAVRRVPAWRSASGGVAGPARYSAFGYANVARHVLGNVLGNRQEAQVVEDPGGDGREGSHVHVEYRAVVVEPVEAYLYRPARAGFLRVSRWARRLQSGRLDAYVAYMLAALIALLIVVVALS
ncbi:MAG TPA: hypothetical protein VE152_12800, partial [Acidimicrobiales bacterium]|nr:hypothetical protein [Acidimicrobiales bacterium]